jgi:HEAT repeat protein
MQKKPWFYISALAVLLLFTYTFWKRTPPAILWEDGARLMYSFEFNRIKTRQEGTRNIPPEEFNLKGTLNFRIMEKAKNIRVLCQFSPLSVTIEGLRHAELDRINKNGRIKSVQVPNTIAREDRNELASIMSQAQFMIKKNITQAWSAREKYPGGEYEADYVYDKSSLYKTKRGYRELYDDDGFPRPGMTALIRESRASFTYGKPFTWLIKASGKETISVISGDESYETVSVRFALRTTRFRPEKNLAVWRETATADEIALQWSSGQQNARSFRDTMEIAEMKRAYGSLAPGDVIAAALDQDRSPQRQAAARLQRYFSLFPQQCRAVPGIMLSGSFTYGQRDTLITALALAGNAEAQHALAAIMKSRSFTEKIRIAAALALGAVDLPEAAAIEELWQAFFNRPQGHDAGNTASDAAAHALGSLTKTMLASGRKDQREQGEAVMKKILAELDEPGDVFRKTALLTAAGRSGTAEARDAIGDFLEADKSLIRSAAAASLGLINDSVADRLLLKSLKGEEMAPVRETIIEALDRDRLDERTALDLAAHLGEESDASVRKKIYLVMLKSGRSPGVAAALQDLFEKESSPENRELIRRFLGLSRDSKKDSGPPR